MFGEVFGNGAREVWRVAEEECSLVGDLGGGEGSGEFETHGGVIEAADLGAANSGGYGAEGIEHGDGSARGGHEDDGDLLSGEQMDCLGGELDVADDCEALDAGEGHVLDDRAVAVVEAERLARDADADAVALGDDMDAVVARGPHSPRRVGWLALDGERSALVVDLVGQADGLERAPRALGVVDQGKRPRPSGRALSCGEFGHRMTAERIVDRQLDASTLLRVVEHSPRHVVPVGFEQKHLQADLDAIGRPRLGADERRLTGFVFVGDLGASKGQPARATLAVLDRDGGCGQGGVGGLGDLSKVEPCGELQLFAGQVQRADGQWASGVVGGRRLGRGEWLIGGARLVRGVRLVAWVDGDRGVGRHGRRERGVVDCAMDREPLLGVGGGDEDALDLHVVEEAWAIGVLTDVAGLPERSVGVHAGSGQWVSQRQPTVETMGEASWSTRRSTPLTTRA